MTTIQQSKFILTTSNGSLNMERNIMCGRGKAYIKNRGNMQYMGMIRANMQPYLEAKTTLDRTAIIASLLQEIATKGTRFIKKDPNTKEWYTMSQDAAHDKIGHSIRDMIARSKKEQKKMKNQKKPSNASLKKGRQTTTPTVPPPPQTICFEPICHQSEAFINHDITSVFCKNSIDFLTNSLSAHHLIETDSTCSSDQFTNTYDSPWDDVSTPDQDSRRVSICMTTLFDGIGMDDILQEMSTTTDFY